MRTRVITRITSTSHKLKRHYYLIQHLNETVIKVWKRMDEQCSGTVKHWTISGLNHH